MKRLILLASLTALLLPAPASAEPGSLPDIEDEVMCPICGTALNLSESAQAERERAFIRRLISEGKTKQEILDALVVEYGEDVLAVPKKSGFELSAWIVPGLGMLIAAVALAVAVRRWRRSGSGRDDAPVSDSSDGDTERLATDMGRYEL